MDEAGAAAAMPGSANYPSAATGQTVALQEKSTDESERALPTEHAVQVVRRERRTGIVDVLVIDGGINLNDVASAHP